MNKIAVYSCITQGYDEPKDQAHILDVDWIMYCDTPLDTAAWSMRKVTPPMPPRKTAKFMKVNIPLPIQKYEYSIWIDGSVTITSPDFVDMAISRLDSSCIALFSHPERDCIYDEAVASMDFPKYDQTDLLRQVAYYRDNRHPRHWGLWAGGIIARRHCPETNALMARWWSEIRRWGVQDQLSLPVALRAHQVWPALIPGNLYDNRWLHVDFAGHKSNL